MVAQLLRLKLRLLGNIFRRSAWQVVGIAMGLIYGLGAAFLEILVRDLSAWLAAQGFDDIFVDHSDIRGGDRWAESLRRATSTCRVVLCLVTPAWLASDECFAEFRAAWYQGKRIIPLLALAGRQLGAAEQARLGKVVAEDQGFDLDDAVATGRLDLTRLAENDSDDLSVRKVLAERRLAREEFDEAARWARECLYIDVNDPAAHVMLGDALLGLDRPGEAAEEYEVALGLEPDDPDAIKSRRGEALDAAGLPREGAGDDSPAGDQK